MREMDATDTAQSYPTRANSVNRRRRSALNRAGNGVLVRANLFRVARVE